MVSVTIWNDLQQILKSLGPSCLEHVVAYDIFSV